jgi:hypothetical protein
MEYKLRSEVRALPFMEVEVVVERIPTTKHAPQPPLGVTVEVEQAPQYPMAMEFLEIPIQEVVEVALMFKAPAAMAAPASS